MRRRSVRTASRVGTKTSLSPFARASGGKLDLERAHQIGDRDVGNLRTRRAGVEPRNVEQRADDLLDRLERDVDIAGEIFALLGVDLVHAFGQRARVKPRRVERLQNIVAGRGEETRLGEIGGVGLVLRPLELGVEPLQFRGALIDAPLEHLVGGRKRFLGLNGLA